MAKKKEKRRDTLKHHDWVKLMNWHLKEMRKLKKFEKFRRRGEKNGYKRTRFDRATEMGEIG